MVETRKISQRKLDKIVGSSAMGYTTTEDSKPIIYLPHHPNTKTRVHEIYHAYSLSEPTKDTLENLIDEEISADIYATEVTGRNFQLTHVIHAGKTAMDIGYRPSAVMSAITNFMAKEGYNFTKDHRSVVWTKLLNFQKELKRQKR